MDAKSKKRLHNSNADLGPVALSENLVDVKEKKRLKLARKQNTHCSTRLYLSAIAVLIAGFASSAAGQGECEWWISSEGFAGKKLEKQPNIRITKPTVSSEPAITIYPDKRRQTILGTGTSFDESSVYFLARMSAATRKEVLTKLFDSASGINWNLIRICFGSSDFCGVPYYTYNDMPPGQTDTLLANFSIQKDIDNKIIDVLKEALAINPNILVFASPWSPPAWMKDNKSLIGGKLLTEYIPVLARYYRKAIQAYEQQGIPIYAMTTQNEPDMVATYPSCVLTAEQILALVHELHKEFAKYFIKTKIWIYDSNYYGLDWLHDRMWYKLLQDTPSRRYVDAIAFHPYIGDPSVQTYVHNLCPWIDVVMSERGQDGTVSFIQEELDIFRNWATAYINWVTASTPSNAHVNGPWSAPGAPVGVSDTDPNAVQYRPCYYLSGQVSRFIKRGAYYLENTVGSGASVSAGAFQNPDGKIVAVVNNNTRGSQTFKILCNRQQIVSTVPPKSTATYVWPDTGETLPFVVIASPERSAILPFSSVTTVHATAWDPAPPSGCITAVEFYVDSVKVATDSTAPYSYEWSPASAGQHFLSAKAIDNSGKSQMSPLVPVFVSAEVTRTDHHPPRSLVAQVTLAPYAESAEFSITGRVIPKGGWNMVKRPQKIQAIIVRVNENGILTKFVATR